jgi:C-terminal processing protease CtpA/Prc
MTGTPLEEEFEIIINPINPVNLSVNEWLEDFQYLYDFVEGNYPFLDVKNRTHGYNWLDLKEMFENQIQNAQNNRDFLDVIMSACQALQNRHTWVMNPSAVVASASDYADSDPLSEIFSETVTDAAEYWQSFYDGAIEDVYNTKYTVSIVYDRGEYVIRDYDASWELLYGNDTIATHVNGTHIDEAITTLYDKRYIDYDFKRNMSYIWSISPRDFGNEAIFTIQNATAQITNVIFDVEVGWIDIPYSYPSIPVNTTTLESEKIGYLYVGSFGHNVEQYYNDVIAFYQEIEDYDYLIIDIRGNTGGFYSVWIEGIVKPLIQEEIVHTQYFAYRTDEYVSNIQSYKLTEIVAKDTFDYLPPEVLTNEFRIHKNYMTYNPVGDINFTGEIVLLIDNIVYSAAEGFTNFCREYDFATIYGTTSGGDGIIIFPLYFVLPNSKLVISSASAIGLDATGHANEEVRTQPDVYYESAFGNWNELINFVIDDILND